MPGEERGRDGSWSSIPEIMIIMVVFLLLAYLSCPFWCCRVSTRIRERGLVSAARLLLLLVVSVLLSSSTYASRPTPFPVGACPNHVPIRSRGAAAGATAAVGEGAESTA